MSDCPDLPTGIYENTCDVQAVFGINNIASWSNLDGGDTLDPVRMQVALNWADATIQSLFKNYGNYVYPLSPVNEGIVIVNYWGSVLAGVWLYESRGLRDDDELGNHLTKLKNNVMNQINDYRMANLLSASLRWPQSQAPTGYSPRQFKN